MGLHRVKSTFEEDGTEDNDLQQTLSDNVLPHVSSDQTLKLRVGLSGEKLIGGRLGGQCQGGQGVHDEVDPQHLDGTQRGFFEDCGSGKGEDEGTDVYGELELQEFAD